MIYPLLVFVIFLFYWKPDFTIYTSHIQPMQFQCTNSSFIDIDTTRFLKCCFYTTSDMSVPMEKISTQMDKWSPTNTNIIIYHNNFIHQINCKQLTMEEDQYSPKVYNNLLSVAWMLLTALGHISVVFYTFLLLSLRLCTCIIII